SAFWMNNLVANMIYPRYSVMAGDLRDAQKELEDYYAEDVAKVTEIGLSLDGEALTEYLNTKTAAYTDKMMRRWDKLFKLIVVKHNDLVMLPSENGELKGNARGGMTYPGYNQSFYDQIGIDLGKRYELKELIIRAER
ncbi:MAG: hypothetical protein J6Z27_03545, partial [Bacteroidales bacterium]|nr:hypothetical protein [Bacteroidales bacterium]